MQGRRESRLPLRFFSGGTPGNIFQNGEYTMNKAKRKAVIAGNWKMNKTATEAASLIDALVPAVQGAGCDVVICTPFTSLCTVWAQKTCLLKNPARSRARYLRICWWIWA